MRIRGCPAAVCRNDRRQMHWLVRAGKQRLLGKRLAERRLHGHAITFGTHRNHFTQFGNDLEAMRTDLRNLYDELKWVRDQLARIGEIVQTPRFEQR